MTRDARTVIGAHVERAWDELLVDMNRRYPVAEWPKPRPYERRDACAQASDAAEKDRNVIAGESRAEMRCVEALFAARGETAIEASVNDVKLDMARVIVGEEPEPRTVTSLDPDTHEAKDAILDDPDVTLTTLAQ